MLQSAVMTLPTPEEKQERHRMKRNILAFRRLDPKVKESGSRATGEEKSDSNLIKDPAEYKDSTGTEIGAVGKRFKRLISNGSTDKDEVVNPKPPKDQALWWSELSEEQKELVRKAQAPTTKKKSK